MGKEYARQRLLDFGGQIRIPDDAGDGLDAVGAGLAVLLVIGWSHDAAHGEDFVIVTTIVA